MSEHQNLVSVFEDSVKLRGDRVCFRYAENGKWMSLSWNDAKRYVVSLAGGLRKLGVGSGTKVCLLSRTRYEWTLTDLAILSTEAVVVPIYESTTTEEIEFIIQNCEAEFIFIENQTQYEKLKSCLKNLPHIKNIFYFDEISSKSNGMYSFEELMMMGKDSGEQVFQAAIQNLTPEHDASFVYTSGTTGHPKGAILTHQNILSELEAGLDAFDFGEDYESLIFLPLAHILARMVQFFQIRAGFIQAYAESVDRILDNISTIKPHFMASVPRIFEKIHTRTMQNVQNSSEGKRRIFEWALAVGEEISRYELNGKSVPLALKIKQKLAHKLVFSKLHEKLGGRVRFFISGGAPLSPDVALFFYAFGFKVLEGYGLTETSAAITVNTLDKIKIGSVGKPVKGAEIKIASDGEILARGPMVFKGYYKNDEATRDAIDANGWFHTGDIGEIDQEGILKITDRKKDIIVTAGGKNIAPQNIENLMKTDPYISQFVVHGDKRKFLSALVTLDRDEILKFAQSQNVTQDNYDDLVKNEKIMDLIRKRIDEKNKQLAKYETIKRFAILPHDFSVESGELTPTLKVKRKVINERYRSLFDGFYSE